jgi:hypothetical protein
MEQYYFTFYCDELCVDLECELEYEEAEPEVGLKDSMTLVSAIPKSALGDGHQFRPGHLRDHEALPGGRDRGGRT